jgi:hypothetical protein
MSDLNRIDSANLSAIREDGTEFPAARLGLSTTWGVTLGVGTYYFPFGASKSPVPAESPLVAVQVIGAAAVAATFSLEDAIFPATTSPGDGRGAVDVTDFEPSSTQARWMPENPADAVVSVTGTGWAVTASTATVTSAGTNLGGAVWHVGNMGTPRWRLKVVTTVGGLVRVAVHGKGGVG